MGQEWSLGAEESTATAVSRLGLRDEVDPCGRRERPFRHHEHAAAGAGAEWTVDRTRQGMKTSELRTIVGRLPEKLPLTDSFDVGRDRSLRWYSSQREHLLGWLGEYDTPGAYGRKNPGQDAKFFYNHFRCAPGLLWLAEALGEHDEILKFAIRDMKDANLNPSSQCAAFRRAVPWDRIAELAEEFIRQKSSSRRFRMRQLSD